MHEVVRTLYLNEAASLVGSSQEELMREAIAGRLQVSVTLESLLAWKASQNTPPPASPPAVVNPAPPAASPTGGCGGINLVLGTFAKIAVFSHRWPDASLEPYDEAYQATAQVNGRSRIIIVGFTQRTSAGLTDRARATVFYQSPPKERALVEFSGNGTLLTATRYACPIKLRGSHSQLRPGEPIPEEYVDLPLEIFSSVVQGPYAANSVAVVVETEDLDTMLKIMATHGVIRGVYKGWL